MRPWGHRTKYPPAQLPQEFNLPAGSCRFLGTAGNWLKGVIIEERVSFSHARRGRGDGCNLQVFRRVP
jgi:hypothetical protein